MNYRIREPNLVPHFGYEYIQPETGTRIPAGDMDQAVKRVTQHRISNNLARTAPDEVLQDITNQICRRLGPDRCIMDTDAWGFNMGWDAVVAGTKTLWGWFSTPEPYVEQAEAGRRAEICSRCFCNNPKPVPGCMSCGAMDLVRDLVGKTCANLSTQHDDKLGSCLVCECLLRCKVHIKPELISSSQKQKNAYAEISECWMNQIS